MNEFQRIVNKNGTVSIEEVKEYKLLGKGNDGSVYQLTPDQCVKIFTNKETKKLELQALQLGQGTPIIPKLYSYGSNYIVMEYIHGKNLDYHLKREKLSEERVKKIIYMLDEMKRIGFKRIDTEVRHIFFNQHGEVKVIDLKRALSKKRHVPTKLMSGLKKRGLLEDFYRHVKTLSPKLYKKIDSHSNGSF